MRSNQDRDAVTLTIVTSLLIFTGVVAVGAVPLLLVDWLSDERVSLGVGGYVLLVCASVVALLYLWRHRRP
jgi:hypothetical protein